MSVQDESHAAKQYKLLHRIGVALVGERDRARLLDLILSEAQELCRADGGTLYLLNERDELEFVMLKNRSLNIELGGIASKPVEFPPIPLFDPITRRKNLSNIATFAVFEKRPVHIPDAYDAATFDFSGTKRFDRHSGYRSKSVLTIPLVNPEDKVIGVLQLLNALSEDGEVIPFQECHQEIVAALAAQAAIALDNKLLMEAHKELMVSFIKLIASAIDAKSPYTGSHCERVPLLTEMLMQELCDAKVGPFADFSLNPEERYEVQIAAWLHDCGKVTTPTHIMDKASKLESVYDKICEVRTRFEVLRRDARLELLESLAAGEKAHEARTRYEEKLARLEADLTFLEQANRGGEFLSLDDQQRIIALGDQTYTEGGVPRRLLSPDEVANLVVSRGTLNDEERYVVNGHMVQTARMLEALPFPRHLRRVPEYATGHHEKMDGTGYPRGIFAGDMSIPARAMAIADVFEALTAHDRPYKKAKKLSETMRIMGFMKRDNHLDPQLFDLFVRQRVYLRYAEKYLDPSLIDDVDEALLLSIEPKPFVLPPESEREARKGRFLEEYERHFPLRRGSSNPFAAPFAAAIDRDLSTDADVSISNPAPE